MGNLNGKVESLLILQKITAAFRAAVMDDFIDFDRVESLKTDHYPREKLGAIVV
jgi:hypothetical protein